MSDERDPVRFVRREVEISGGRTLYDYRFEIDDSAGDDVESDDRSDERPGDD